MMLLGVLIKREDQMKAAVRSTYGLPEVLGIKEMAIPAPKDNEVLIRVYATTVNRTDCHVLWGRPLFMRLFTGLLKPRLPVTGSDFAGAIEAVGPSVRSFKVGDRVMGFGGVFGCGSHAQYLAFPEDKGIVTIPGNLTYAEAAASLEGAYYAGSSIIQLHPQPGQKALVYGATGAIGSSYVQLLKYNRVSITAVCRGENRELVQSLGADKVIDYTIEDFTQDNEQYDFVFDAAGKTSFRKCRRLLKKHGIYSWSNGLENIFLSLVTPLLGGKKVVFQPPINIRTGLNWIRELIETGNFRPVIDRSYPLDRIAEAFTYVGSGQKIGNVIINWEG
jgi:NADPH:quinone reductase-like Zn-dependent oxidoreductase